MNSALATTSIKVIVSVDLFGLGIVKVFTLLN